MDAEALVFVVDDDASLRASLQDLLESVGLRVEAFASAQEFLRRPRPEVVWPKNSTAPFSQSLRSRHACSSSSSSEVGMLDAVLPLKTENRPTVCQHADQGLQESAHRS
jgi:CheY-like chemotaxis protein